MEASLRAILRATRPAPTERKHLRALVLGGGGFIGSHLVTALLAQGALVRVLERPYRTRMPSIPNHPSLEWQEGDFGNVQDIHRALKEVDVVFHLVSTTQPQSSNDDPSFDVESNLAATLRLLEQLRGTKTLLIFASSGGTVYGRPQHTPIPETHPTEPTCSYGIVKLAIEKYLALYRLLHGLDYRILRVANPYGPGQEANRAQGVVGTFLSRVVHGEPIEVWGDGSVVRDYLYVSDTVSALIQAAGYRGEQRIFNIGSGGGHSVREIIAAVEQVTGKKAQASFTAARKFDVPVSVLDIARARKELGWQPNTDLSEGLRLTLAHIK
ncbi:MAG: NAD-dependent epimerase/dehydratase family protein [Nitrosomonadales bacterium]|nr:NAD-dependent epimerase/dehydratase family protein [Nitrosomonadales bacterium]